MFSLEHIVLNDNSKTKNQVLREISKLALNLEICSDESLLYEDLLLREEQTCTGMQMGVAIPHAKSNAVKKPSVIFYSLKNEVEWESLDDEPIRVVIALLVPGENKDNIHLKMLSNVAVSLMDVDLINKLKEATTKNEIYMLLEKTMER